MTDMIMHMFGCSVRNICSFFLQMQSWSVSGSAFAHASNKNERRTQRSGQIRLKWTEFDWFFSSPKSFFVWLLLTRRFIWRRIITWYRLKKGRVQSHFQFISGFLLRKRAARDTYYGSVWSMPIHSYGVDCGADQQSLRNFDFLMTPTGWNDPVRAWKEQAICLKKTIYYNHSPALNRPCLRAGTQPTYFLSFSTSSVCPLHFAMNRSFYFAPCPKRQGGVNNFRVTLVWYKLQKHVSRFTLNTVLLHTKIEAPWRWW